MLDGTTWSCKKADESDHTEPGDVLPSETGAE